MQTTCEVAVGIDTTLEAAHEMLTCLEDLVSNDGEACQTKVMMAGSRIPLHKLHCAAYMPMSSHLKVVCGRDVFLIGPILDSLRISSAF